MKATSAIFTVLLCVAAISGEEKKAEKHHHHAHKAPHGGCLVAVGDHFAHLEFVLDAATGKLTAYVLDGEAEKSVRVKQKEIKVEVEGRNKNDKAFEIELKAVANVLTGETAGDSSQFEVTDERLKGLKEFFGNIEKLEIKGQKAKDIDFDFPKGNEGGHDHKH